MLGVNKPYIMVLHAVATHKFEEVNRDLHSNLYAFVEYGSRQPSAPPPDISQKRSSTFEIREMETKNTRTPPAVSSVFSCQSPKKTRLRSSGAWS